MSDPHHDSITLDAAHLRGGVGECIEQFANEANAEVERAINRNNADADDGDAG